MKNKLEFVLCSGFLFLGGLAMCVIFPDDGSLELLGGLFCWLGALGLLVNHLSIFFRWLVELPSGKPQNEEDHHENARSE